MPGDRRAPVVPHDDRPLGAHRVEHAQRVADVVQERVVLDRVRCTRAGVAALVGRHGVEARCGQGGELVTPRVPALGEAVQQEHGRAVDGACLGDVQVKAVDGQAAVGDGVGHDATVRDRGYG